MNSHRKTMCISLIALGSWVSAPLSLAADTPSASAPAATASSVLEQLDPAVRNYLLSVIAKSFEILGAITSQGDAVKPVDVIFGVTQAMRDIPTDGLPDEYRNFIYESKGLEDKMMGELNDNPSLSQVQQLKKKYKPRFAAIEAKYPQAASLLGEKNKQAMSTLLVQELGIQQKAMQYVSENKEKFAGKSQQAIMGEVFAYMAKEIAKQIK